MRERLIRILIIIMAALVIVAVAKALADWRNQQKIAGESVSLPQVSVKEKLEDLGEDILGKVIEVLPGEPKIETVDQVDQDSQVNQEDQETEPIEEPVKNVEKQTEILIQTIKELPQDQIEAIKKQIYKEICEPLLEK